MKRNVGLGIPSDFTLDFWSVPVEEVAVPAGEATLNTLPSVVVAGLPGGAVIVRAIAMFKAM